MTTIDTLRAAKIAADTDRDTLYEQTMAAREQTLQDFKERELVLKERIELLKQNGEMARKLKDSEDKADKIKAELAMKSAELETQKELSAAALVAGREARKPSQVEKPPTEPAGRATNGQAYAL